MLAELAAVDASVRIVLDGGAVVTGTIREATADVVVMSVLPEGEVAYLVLAAVNEVSSMSMTSSS